MSSLHEPTDPPRPIWRKTVADWLWPWRIWPAIWRNLTTAPDCGPGDDSTPDGREALRQLAARPASLTLRHLDCGSCNGCELQLIALSNPCYDMERYGIAMEASPRHAVYLAMTGPFTYGLKDAALCTLEAMPEPAIIAIGDCTREAMSESTIIPIDDCGVEAVPESAIIVIGDGAKNDRMFEGSYAVVKPPREIERAIRYWIPGCPPSPTQILEALARIALPKLGKATDSERRPPAASDSRP